jgi:2-(1,2-epoxy-1,2-dihydrophenyl)acetyl-CoA isomerase
MTGEQSVGSPAVLVERRGAVGLVRLNETKSLNALSPAIKDGLQAALCALLPDPAVRALVITGSGRAFCAGGDIRGMDDRATVAMRRRMHGAYSWLVPLITADKPVITAVNGVAAGAGLSLAMTGDIILASRAARFKAGFAGIGAVPDLSLAWMLPQAVGLVRAKTILLENREFDAEAACAIGLVTRVTQPDALLDHALVTAEALASGPTVAFGVTKQLLRRAHDTSLESFLELEAMAQTVAFGSADFAEGVAAFRAKRPAAFGGG